MKIDKDKSGLLDSNEIREAIQMSRQKMSEKEVHQLIQNIDNNSNVKIDYTEFLVATINLQAIVTDELLASLFSCFDIDHTGGITVQSTKDAFNKFGKSVTDEEIKQIFKEFDTDHNERIDFKEFQMVMNSF